MELTASDLELANTQMIVARRNPEDQQSTTDLYWAEGITLAVRLIVQKNARVEDLKNRFNQISLLPGSLSLQMNVPNTAALRAVATWPLDL